MFNAGNSGVSFSCKNSYGTCAAMKFDQYTQHARAFMKEVANELWITGVGGKAER